MSEEMKKYLDMIASMAIDCRMGGITEETFVSNLEACIPLLKKIMESKG